MNKNFQIQNWNTQTERSLQGILSIFRNILLMNPCFCELLEAIKMFPQMWNPSVYFYHQILILVWFSEVGCMQNLSEFKGLPITNSKTCNKNIHFKSHIQDNWVFQIRKSCSNFPLWYEITSCSLNTYWRTLLKIQKLCS